MLQLNTHRRKTPNLLCSSVTKQQAFLKKTSTGRTKNTVPSATELNHAYKALFITETYVSRMQGETVRLLLPELLGHSAARDVVTCFIASGRAAFTMDPSEASTGALCLQPYLDKE